MKVLYIIDPGIVGGATLAFLEIVAQMKTRSVDCIVCTSGNNSLNRELDKMGVANIAIGHHSVLEPESPYKWKRPIKYPIRWLQYRIALKKALKTIERKIDLSDVDIIHTNSHRNDIGCYLNKKYGIPHIVHIREFSDADFKCITYRKKYISILNQFTTKYIAISEAVKNHWIRKGVDKNKLMKIYDGISFNNGTVSDDECKSDHQLKLVMTGGICYPKGQHLVVGAMACLSENIRNNITVDFIGWDDPRYTRSLKEKIDIEGMSNLFRFVGAVKNATNLLGDYHIGLMCSQSEGFGRVTAEYMAARLGVIASDSGANPELIQNGVNGLLFNSGDENDLAEKILKFYNNRDLLVSCSTNAQIDAQKKYSEDLNAHNIYELYQALLNQ